ncbi:hypothetical protein BOX15_Mlig018609g2 [Macrostomum lignano]|uniref:C-type lectin domain-containing protein n=2 Tax=Macrostomum lignano TaxID=282301 RepID=A0A1I8HQN0_9PLAT|nr:hypothetical protein BOX15_Mlig018609g2 [Macrostomum lignano]
MLNMKEIIVFLSMAVLASGTSHHHQQRCPEDAEDWHYFNGWCYSLSEAAEGWFGSEKACQKLGGHLASIASREENSFVQALGQCQQNAWIGLVKTDVSDRKFSWWDDAAFNYTERFSINIHAYYDCVYQSGSNYGRWYNTYCQNQYRSVCMVPAREESKMQHTNVDNGLVVDESVTKDELTNRTMCPEGWLAIEGSCFYVSSKRTNYFNAQISCESMGATVASVSSRREQVLLTMALGCDSRIWIGLEKVKPCLSDSSKSYCYMWMDGSEIGYADWASGHPSSSNEIECTYTLGRWYTTNCYNEYNFVCKKK